MPIASKARLRQVRKANLSATKRVQLAFGLVSGKISPPPPTQREACRLVGISTGYLSTYRNLSNQRRDDIRDGRASLSRLHNTGNGRLDVEVNAFLQRVGIELRK